MQIERAIKTNSWPLFNRKTSVQTLGRFHSEIQSQLPLPFLVIRFTLCRQTTRGERQPSARCSSNRGAIEPLVSGVNSACFSIRFCAPSSWVPSTWKLDNLRPDKGLAKQRTRAQRGGRRRFGRRSEVVATSLIHRRGNEPVALDAVLSRQSNNYTPRI